MSFNLREYDKLKYKSIGRIESERIFKSLSYKDRRELQRELHEDIKKLGTGRTTLGELGKKIKKSRPLYQRWGKAVIEHYQPPVAVDKSKAKKMEKWQENLQRANIRRLTWERTGEEGQADASPYNKTSSIERKTDVLTERTSKAQVVDRQIGSEHHITASELAKHQSSSNLGQTSAKAIEAEEKPGFALSPQETPPNKKS